MFNKVVGGLLTIHSFEQLREKRQVGDWSVVRIQTDFETSFLQQRDTMPCFHGVGKDSTVSDELMMTVMYGASNEAQSFSSHVGSGSNRHCLEGAALINDTTVSASTVSKLSSLDV